MEHPTHDRVELLAYQLWQHRGCPLGTPETDWFEAERRLEDPMGLIELAREVGGAIGSVVALLGHTSYTLDTPTLPWFSAFMLPSP